MARSKSGLSLHRASASLSLSALFLLSASAIAIDRECPVFSSPSISCTPLPPRKFLPGTVPKAAWEDDAAEPDLGVLSEVLNSIGVMQDDYFAAWLGTWPTSIDWTGAVLGTYVAGTLQSFSGAFILVKSSADQVEDWKLKENLVENYFAQVVSYYFGQNAFEIRGEAYDDILWVVLGWLEAIRFINEHTDVHYTLQTEDVDLQINVTNTVGSILRNQTWHGNLWIPSFSHRARVFWDLASKGWDTQLCGGGMTWNPKLLPYKNAITNELFIAASISMYLYFPGDDNMSPFLQGTNGQSAVESEANQSLRPHDPVFLKAAVDGYNWLTSSNMTDAQGLFTDGFHISGLSNPETNNTKCDERNDNVYTYNQGVLLTGQRGLWEATGGLSYLVDGHKLIQNVINATGYDLEHDQPRENSSSLAPDTIPRWYGLGRLGVLEDSCDASGTCSQDGQTFKGIFFHHLTYFCGPLNAPAPEFGLRVDFKALEAARQSHNEACLSYGGWLKWNVEAAIGTRDKDGKFGMWWTAGLLTNFTGTWPTMTHDGIDHQALGIDYRNYGVPNDTTWQLKPPHDMLDPGRKMPVGVPILPDGESELQQPINVDTRKRQHIQDLPPQDPNNRGRGRTVETQGGGLALMRAYWNIVYMSS
jgi:hypothetical protein